MRQVDSKPAESVQHASGLRVAFAVVLLGDAQGLA